MQHDKVTSIYQISFLLVTLSSLTLWNQNIQTMQVIYWSQTETTSNTGMVQATEDWKTNLSKIIQPLWNVKTPATVQKWISVKTVNPSTTSHTEKESKPTVQNKPPAPTKTIKAINIAPTNQTPLKSNCNTDCKIETLIKLGITSNLSNLIVSECTEWAIDPRHCIIIASSILINESGGGKSNACKTRYNCFWVASWWRVYSSLQEWVSQWVSIYSRKWYKAKDASFFYPDKWKYSPSRYCVSETSSNSGIGCPFWQKHMQNVWNKLDKLFN